MSLALEAQSPTTTTSTIAGRTALASTIAVVACLIVGVAPLAWHFARDLYSREEYTCFMMIPIAAVVLVRRPLDAAGVRRGPWWIAGLLIAAAWICLAVGALIYLRWSIVPAAALLFVGVVYRLGGRSLVRWSAPAPVLLLVSAPLPSAIANPLLLWLRGVAVAGSGHVFDVLGLPNARTGTVIEIPGRRLLIEEACSGINSLTAILAFAVLFAYLTRLTRPRFAAVVIAAVGFALIANVARIVAVGVGIVWFGVDLLNPTLHEWLGLMTFTLALGLVLSADQLVALLAPAQPHASATIISPASSARTPSSIHPAWSLIAIAFLAVGLWSGDRLWGGWPGSTLSSDAVFLPPRTVGPWTLDTGAGAKPHEIQSLNVQNYGWTYRDGERRAEVSFTYPFAHGIHDCTTCYVVSGWTIDDRTIDQAMKGTTADLSRPGPLIGRLVYATFDEHGEWQPPTPLPDGPWLAARIAYEGDVARQTPGYEMQVLGLSDASVDEPTRASLRALFLTLRDELCRQMLAQRSITQEAKR